MAKCQCQSPRCVESFALLSSVVLWSGAVGVSLSDDSVSWVLMVDGDEAT